LVVDDNADYAEATALLLRMAGHETEVAFDGWQALEIAESQRPDVVLLDIGMQGLNGYEVARHLKDRTNLKLPLIIAVTGHGSERDKCRSYEAGIDLHLVKPFHAERLLQLLCRFQNFVVEV